MVEVSRFIENELSVDFVDINCCCPMDLLYNKGMGVGKNKI
jgi:tRNA-dihydrouridine synthase